MSLDDSRMAVAVPAYRRPDCLAQVLARVSASRVSHVFIGIDGPRAGAEAAVAETMDVALDFAQRSRVPTIIRQRHVNAGTAVNVLSTIDWMFAHVERGAVLEEDCVPTDDFFDFCDAALQRYESDDTVWMAAGSQLAPSDLIEGTHVLSPYGLIWGWATTRKKWKSIHEHLEASLQIDAQWSRESAQHAGPNDRVYWRAGHRRSAEGYLDSWAMPITAVAIMSGRRGALPPSNLVVNVGNDERSTHTAGDVRWTWRSADLGARLPLENPLQADNERVSAWLRKQLFGIGWRHQVSTRVTRLRDVGGASKSRGRLLYRLGRSESAGEFHDITNF